MQIYNSLSRTKEEFQPLSGNRVTIYSCGPTVYDLSHIGHARVSIIWDVFQRYLRFRGYDVTFVRNITDIEDKIINRAKELGAKPDMVSRKFLYEFWKDMDSLNCMQPDVEPRATEFLHEMIAFIQGLIVKGHAYESQGDVYFDVKSFKSYGRLTKQNLDDLMVGWRDQVLSQSELEKRKKHPADFALWKGAPESEMGWPSPWGHGRPGWHLECSCMIKHILGETIDLHGGGEDLLFPHHENEIAQSEGLHGKPLARFFVHNSFVQVNGEKMAKSLGNFKTIRDLLVEFSSDDIRLFVLQTHYRNPIDFAVDSLQGSKSAVRRLVKAAHYADLPEQQIKYGIDTSYGTEKDFDLDDSVSGSHGRQFIEAMDNDFNTAQAVAVLFSLSDAISKESDPVKRTNLANTLKRLARVLGFRLEDNSRTLKPQQASGLVDVLIGIRSEAKRNKDFATADSIRKGLGECGVSLMDSANGVSWERS